MIGGPVFQRELATIPRSWRLYFLRSAYVGALFGLAATAWLILFGSQPVRGLSDLSRFGSAVCALIAPVHMAVAVAFSALLAAAAVAQEKDRRTFDLLLMTRLTNSELVVGKLLASMLAVLVLILAVVPLGMLLALLGGVSNGQLARATGVTLTAALAAGSIGSTCALWREKTFQSLALTALALALWLLLGEAMSGGAFGDAWWGAAATDWAAAASPLRAILAAVQASTDRGAMLADWPAAGDAVRVFMFAATALAAALNIAAVARVRVWNPSQEVRVPSADERADAAAHAAARSRAATTGVRSVHAAPGKVREVWDNPILWREIRTWAYGKKVILVRLGYLAVFAACAANILRQLDGGAANVQPGALPAAAHAFIPLTVLGLVLVNALAVTSMTNERDGGALDLLLVTDLTPKEIILGKLGGTFYNAKEVILLPALLCVYAWWRGALGGENLALVLATLAVAFAFVATLGLHAGMTYPNSRTAVAASLGTLLFLLLGIAVCMRMMVAFQTSFINQFLAFMAFMLGGGVGLFCALGIRNPSPAIGWAMIPAPFWTFYSIATFLQGNYGAAALVIAATYGFATAALLVPAIAEFDVATGRTAAKDL